MTKQQRDELRKLLDWRTPGRWYVLPRPEFTAELNAAQSVTDKAEPGEGHISLDNANAVAALMNASIALLDLADEADRLREELEGMAEGDCLYGDSCPVSRRHGRCYPCKARRALARPATGEVGE